MCEGTVTFDIVTAFEWRDYFFPYHDYSIKLCVKGVILKFETKGRFSELIILCITGPYTFTEVTQAPFTSRNMVIKAKIFMVYPVIHTEFG